MIAAVRWILNILTYGSLLVSLCLVFYWATYNPEGEADYAVSAALFTFFVFVQTAAHQNISAPNYKHYLGDWTATWTYHNVPNRDEILDEPQPFSITKVNILGHVKANSYNGDVKGYGLSGTIKETVICLQYDLSGGRKGNHGVVMLKRNTDPNILTGHWMQYFSRNDIAYGNVTLVKNIPT